MQALRYICDITKQKIEKRKSDEEVTFLNKLNFNSNFLKLEWVYEKLHANLS